jgi:hypothetical protein
VDSMGNKRNVYKILVEKPGKRQTRRPRRRENNINIGLREADGTDSKLCLMPSYHIVS